MKVLVDKTYTFVDLIWTAYVAQNKTDIRYCTLVANNLTVHCCSHSDHFLMMKLVKLMEKRLKMEQLCSATQMTAVMMMLMVITTDAHKGQTGSLTKG